MPPSGQAWHPQSVIADDFFTHREQTPSDDPWAVRPSPTTEVLDGLDTDLLKSLRLSSLPGRSDLEVLITLSGLVNDELLAYGTGGGQELTDDEMAHAILTLHAVTKRVGISFEVPFRNFTTFRSHWVRNGAHGSWQGRRDILESLFEPLFGELFVREQVSLEALGRPITPHSALGWPGVDEEISELRRRFGDRNDSAGLQRHRPSLRHRARGVECHGVRPGAPQ